MSDVLLNLYGSGQIDKKNVSIASSFITSSLRLFISSCPHYEVATSLIHPTVMRSPEVTHLWAELSVSFAFVPAYRLETDFIGRTSCVLDPL